jgi:hypothetical protein
MGRRTTSSKSGSSRRAQAGPVTPFDPVALVAMLLTFYPIVSRGFLDRARTERPSYFAGGALIGSSRTHLQLADGRIFDLIFDEGSPRARWQALDVTVGGPEVDDPFALEDGPLEPLDPIDFEPLPPGESFEGLAVALAGELAAADDAAGLAHTGLAVVADPSAFEHGTGDDLTRAAVALGEEALALDVIRPDEVILVTNDAADFVDVAIVEWDALDPGELPGLPTPPNPPAGEPPDPGGDKDHPQPIPDPNGPDGPDFGGG